MSSSSISLTEKLSVSEKLLNWENLFLQSLVDNLSGVDESDLNCALGRGF